jgi:hypothetical protein
MIATITYQNVQSFLLNGFHLNRNDCAGSI